MRKLLFIIPIIFSTFCIMPAYCACTPGDTDCPTKRDATYSATCQTDGADCQKTGAKIAKCKPIDNTLRCTAHECSNDYYLWFYGGNSMGVCYTKAMAENYCSNPKYCTERNCEPKFEKKTHYDKSINAFTGCVKKQKQSNTTPEQPTIPSTPESGTPAPSTPTNTGCTLTFANGESIENVDFGESAKPEYTDTVIMVNNTRQNTESFYQISLSFGNKFIQNKDSRTDGYNENIPHLFDLVKVNNTPVPQNEHKELQKSAYIWFECTNGVYKITTKTIEQPYNETPSTTTGSQSGITAELKCTENSCKAGPDIFTQIETFITDNKAIFGKSSVWKNDEGKFNTARLASDSIAGVVLGTAGGIITSQVVKKNQIKNGFEDLKCTIGGQVVATYGDEFVVGMK